MAQSVVTGAEAKRVRNAFGRLQNERDELRTALAQSQAMESIGLKLGDELITASREAVAAWHERHNIDAYDRRINSGGRMDCAIARLEELVGKP